MITLQEPEEVQEESSDTPEEQEESTEEKTETPEAEVAAE